MQNLRHRFDRYYIGQIKGGDFAKSMGPSHKYFLKSTHVPISKDLCIFRDLDNFKDLCILRDLCIFKQCQYFMAL